MPFVIVQKFYVMTKEYAYDDWAVKTIDIDRDGNVNKKHFVPCSLGIEGANHRASSLGKI